MTLEFTLLMLVSLAVVVSPVVAQARRLPAQLARLRAQQAQPLTRVVRYTLREVVVVRPGAEIVAFPKRPLPAPHHVAGLRHAA